MDGGRQMMDGLMDEQMGAMDGQAGGWIDAQVMDR